MKIATYYYNHFRGRMENWFFDEHTWQATLRGMVQGTFVLCQKNPEAMTILQYFYELWTSRAPSNGFNRDGSWFNGAGYFQTNQYTLYYYAVVSSHGSGLLATSLVPECGKSAGLFLVAGQSEYFFR